MTDTALRINLLHMSFISPFRTASGRCGDKDTVLLSFEDGSEWELTWSPSMGVDPKALYEFLIGEAGRRTCSFQRFVINHLQWKKLYNSNRFVMRHRYIRGEEYGVRESTAPTIHTDTDLLKIKCKETIPAWITSVQLPKYVLFDFNGSAQSLEHIDNQLEDITSKYKYTKFFIEQPFTKVIRPTATQVGYVHDCANYRKALEQGDICKGDIAVLKFGRNSVREFIELRGEDIDVLIGSVLSLDSSYGAVRQMNRRFSTFCIDPIYRDGNIIDSNWKGVESRELIDSRFISVQSLAKRLGIQADGQDQLVL